MVTLRAAIIGTGRPRRKEGATGFGMGHFHAEGFKAAEDCELVAVADIKPENAEAFAEEHPGVRPYTNHNEMLKSEKPDIVSICLWDHLHCPMTMDCIAAGVKVVHCEKPMAPTFGEARKMHEAAREAGVQLTFNHEMRFNKTIQEAKRLLDADAIGDLTGIETSCGNLFDEGTHWFDLAFFYNGQTPAEWLIGQIDSRTERSLFGVRHEDQSIAQFLFENGVAGLMATGPGAKLLGAERIVRLIGSAGVIEVVWGMPPDEDKLRIRRAGTSDWEDLVVTDHFSGPDMLVGALSRGIVDAIDGFRTGRTPLQDSQWALQATELIFATYESSRRRARIDLPLDIDDSPLLSMLEQGTIGPKSKEA
jgi:UDP-N-acetylglucosamine 3-dehydrogenase